MLGRTALFVPADRPDRFTTAAESGTDMIIVDLEDAVAPDRKDIGRRALCRPGALPEQANIVVRVNARGTAWHEADLTALCNLTISGIVLPKTEGAHDIMAVRSILKFPIIALIETALGHAACREIARSDGVLRLAFGSLDYAADLGMAHTREGLSGVRSEIVLASRLAGLAAPIDGVALAINDSAMIEDDARYAHMLGFGGKFCIHPKQIVAVRSGFLPSEAEIAWARRILAVTSDGAVAVDGAMVDAPVRIRAEQILRCDES